MSKSPSRTALRAGLAATAVVSLAACGTSSSDGGSEAAASLGATEGSVSILAWPGYVEDGSNDASVDWVSGFEEATGCMVDAKTYGTSDEAYQLMQSGGYDVVAASGDLTLRLIAADLVAPVNTDLLESYDGIFDFLKDKEWNSVDGVSYGVPHGYGANLLMFNTDEVSPAPTSWDVVFDKASDYAGKVTAYDSPIYIADAAMYLMAHNPDLGIENPYALDEDQFAAAVDLLKTQNASIGEYWSDYLLEIQAFESGDSVVGTTWQVIQNSISSGNTDVVLPEEGATGWSDTWMIASESEAPNCAYAWLDYIASPEVNAQATAYFGEAPSSEAACDFRDDCEAYHAGDEEYAAQIWYWTTPVSDCVDGREDVECVDYSEWTKAWQEIKG
ncbi:extracellular solute-binding protein [Demequina gelatinilytica]|uniref:extracellular solute-binding protein n=1 Tax=Demequina gelatinilytica TaxID=1638980 RepID=UPI000780DABB|nr:extracellular solute-binding protein [Demequina gelatinilytica]